MILFLSYLVKNSIYRVSVICKLAMEWYVMRMCASWLCPRKTKVWSRSQPLAVPLLGTYTVSSLAFSLFTIGNLRFAYGTRMPFQFYSGFTSSNHLQISSHELPALTKANMRSEGSRNVTGLNIENRTRTQYRTLSAILRSLIFASLA